MNRSAFASVMNTSTSGAIHCESRSIKGSTSLPKHRFIAPKAVTMISKPINEEASAEHIELDSTKAADQENQDESTRKLERSLVRKLDMTLMPVIWILYLLNYLDRNNIA